MNNIKRLNRIWPLIASNKDFQITVYLTFYHLNSSYGQTVICRTQYRHNYEIET